jgi:stage III sporulation protein SpoIIIAA
MSTIPAYPPLLEHSGAQEFLDALPERLRPIICDRLDSLVDVMLDLGRLPTAKFISGIEILDQNLVTDEDLQQVLQAIGSFNTDNRAGISGTLHRISALRNTSEEVVGLTMRYGRIVTNSVQLIGDLLAHPRSILIVGRPGAGKTTLLRQISSSLAQQSKDRSVIIVDTSNEIGGLGDVPHSSIYPARRLQVGQPRLLHAKMYEAVKNHTPGFIITDEIATDDACRVAMEISEEGVILIASAHGNSLGSIVQNQMLRQLVGGVSQSTVGDREARRHGGRKTKLERQRKSHFDSCIEILGMNAFAIHSNVNSSVDLILNGLLPDVEVRHFGADGSVVHTRRSLWIAEQTRLAQDRHAA